MGQRIVMCTSTGCLDYVSEQKELQIPIIRCRVYFQGKEYEEGYD